MIIYFSTKPMQKKNHHMQGATNRWRPQVCLSNNYYGKWGTSQWINVSDIEVSIGEKKGSQLHPWNGDCGFFFFLDW